MSHLAWLPGGEIGQPVPRYPHDDCPSCLFLGTYKERDLYVCSSMDGSIIGRYGEDGAYGSYPIDRSTTMRFAAESLPWVAEALRLCALRLIRTVAPVAPVAPVTPVTPVTPVST